MTGERSKKGCDITLHRSRYINLEIGAKVSKVYFFGYAPNKLYSTLGVPPRWSEAQIHPATNFLAGIPDFSCCDTGGRI